MSAFQAEDGVSITLIPSSKKNEQEVNILNYEDRIGEEHGCYVITDIVWKNGRRRYIYTCKECGYQTTRRYSEKPGFFSNQCTHKTYNPYVPKYKHKFKVHRVAKCFTDMCQRCNNPEDKSYKWYGEKGIAICDEWLKNPSLFEEWALNNGYEDGLTIDRINSDGGYCPENCRWITPEENSRRAGKVNWITVGDETLTGRQWSEKLGLGIMSINKWVKNYGLNRTIKLIEAIQKDPEKKNERKSKQSLFDLYDV